MRPFPHARCPYAVRAAPRRLPLRALHALQDDGATRRVLPTARAPLPTHPIRPMRALRVLGYTTLHYTT